MPLPPGHSKQRLSWLRTGQQSQVLDDQSQPTGQVVWEGRIGERNVDVNGDGSDYQPYHFDLAARKLRYGETELDFADFATTGNGHKVSHRVGGILKQVIREQNLTWERFRTQQQDWQPVNLGNPGLPTITEDTDKGELVISLNYSARVQGNDWLLQVDYIVGRSDYVRMRFIMEQRDSVAHDVRLSWQHLGVEPHPTAPNGVFEYLVPDEAQIAQAIQSTGVGIAPDDPSMNFVRSGIWFGEIQFGWKQTEDPLRTVTVTDDSTEPGKKDVDIMLGPFTLQPSTPLIVEPDTEGPISPTANNDSVGFGGSTSGHMFAMNWLYIQDSADANGSGWGMGWDGIDLNAGGGVDSIDSGTEISGTVQSNWGGSINPTEIRPHDSQAPPAGLTGSNAPSSNTADYESGAGNVDTHTLYSSAPPDPYVLSVQNCVEFLVIDQGYTYDGTAGNERMVLAHAAGEWGLTDNNHNGLYACVAHASTDPATLTIVYTPSAAAAATPPLTVMQRMPYRHNLIR